MTKEQLDALIAQARATTMTEQDRETQRLSFAYGNAHFENVRITRASVKRESEKLKSENMDGPS